jgi:hypothetical protein
VTRPADDREAKLDENPSSTCDGDRLSASVRVKFLMKTRDVDPDRLRAEEESSGDLAIREALG